MDVRLRVMSIREDLLETVLDDFICALRQTDGGYVV